MSMCGFARASEPRFGKKRKRYLLGFLWDQMRLIDEDRPAQKSAQDIRGICVVVNQVELQRSLCCCNTRDWSQSRGHFLRVLIAPQRFLLDFISAGMDGVRILDQDQPRLRPHCNNNAEESNCCCSTLLFMTQPLIPRESILKPDEESFLI